jgi:pimeloyl-ACP methyl ester carboxylesterase/membrane protein DedA with SNARE-associated domain
MSDSPRRLRDRPVYPERVRGIQSRWMRRRFVLPLAVFGGFLAASHASRVWRPLPVPAAGARTVVLPPGAAAPADRHAVTIAYRDLGANTSPSASPALIVHGSPADTDDMLAFARELAQERRTIAPDLPGSGGSTRELADYGFPAQASRLHALLDRLGVSAVHLVGFSMGGGVVLTYADTWPAQARSVSLVSAIGVQEMELFGSYRPNHAVHAAQLALLWAAREGLPHFGLLDRTMLGVPYARTFYDSDQRPLREILQRLQPPVLIVHGRHDRLVPVAAAREHARLAAQSELVELDSDHFAVLREPGTIVPIVTRFLDRVDNGLGVIRHHADRVRLHAAALPFDAATVPPPGPVAVLVLMALLALATFASEDLACVSAGMLVAHGQLGFPAAVAACAAGILAGDLGLFFAGRIVGRPIVTWWPVRRWLTPARLAASASWIDRHGIRVVLASRFVPGTRLPTYVAAGVLGVRTWPFASAFAVAVLLWTPLVVGASAVGATWTAVALPHPDGLTSALLVTAFLIVWQVVQRLVTHDGRRRLLSLWRRVSRWEFWPPWVVYPPVLAWIGLLAIRYRSCTIFTAANPGIPAAGFVGESKSDILRALRDGAAPVAPFTVLHAEVESDARIAFARSFARAHGWPVVLKPDQGQRGTGVSIVRSAGALEGAVRAAPNDTVLQAFVPGVEFGVFYVRRLRDPMGRIVSITEKRLPEVVGDGQRTLQRLILDDDRAVAMWRIYSRANDEHLLDVVPAGEAVRICEIGAHCRGAVFIDARALVTPALVAAIDQSARAMSGFFFGRFDVRSPSIDDFRAGRFTILELNGVTSEPVHIYDPAIGLLAAYRALAASWALAFAIGAEQAAAGARVWRPRDLAKLALQYRRFARRPSHVTSRA